jgi:hypothetical protein
MKNVRWTLCLVILFSVLAEARDVAPTGLAIKASPQTVKTVAALYLSRFGYTMDSEEPSQIVFVKDMEGFTKFVTIMVLSPSSCKIIAPRQFLTLNLSETAEGTVATISAEFEHTAISPTCETVRDAPIRKRRPAYKDILEKIRTNAEVYSPQNTAPRRGIDTEIQLQPQSDDRWLTLLGY